MNKRNFYTLSLCCLLTLAACDDYLDIKPKGTAILSTTEDFLGLLEEVSPNYEQSNSWILCGEASWYKAEELKAYTYPLISTAFFWDETYDRAANTIQSELYNDCYNRITKYNAMIDGLPSSKGKETDKEIGIAQAKIMRAYNHFFLVNTFAQPYDPETAYETNGIIVREKMFESIEDEGIQRSVGYTYDFIQQDIKEALATLPHKAVNSFRPNRTFGWAFKAKVHLFRREYDECIQACNEALKEAPEGGHELWNMIIPYATYMPQLIQAGYPEMAIDEPEYVGKNDFVEQVWKTRIEYGYDAPEQLLYQFADTYTSPYPMYVTKEVLDLFERDIDLRYRYCIQYKALHETAPEGSQNFATLAVKWNPGGMRLSEVYLMLAECYARSGEPEDIQTAITYLNTLRSNRLVPKRNIQLSASSKEEALKLVRQERKRELFLTCNGFFDMRRFCAETGESVNREFEGKTYTLSAESHLLTYPFPLKAMQTSVLKQNSK